MARYYHVQRSGVTRFRLGKTYQIGGSANNFSKDLFQVDLDVPVQGTPGLPIDYLLRDYFDPEGFGHYKRITAPNLADAERGLLEAAHSVLRHQSMLLRELIFEQVRVESFPEKPSRLKGMWLIPHHEQLLAEWCATAPHGRFRAFEVEAAGNLHCGYSALLQPECIGAIRWMEAARRYWGEAPRDPIAEPVEILLEGEVTVLREIEMPGSMTTAWTKLKSLFRS
jgi:hypothetical protein